MELAEDYLQRTAVPADGSWTMLDARELPPPEPLAETLEQLETLADDVVFLQLNDRAPQFLFPRLDDRGYAYDTLEVDEGTLTAIWQE